MKLTIRALLTCVICFVAIPAALAKPQRNDFRVTGRGVTGVFDDFTTGRASGDIEGMRVVLVAAGGGHYAIVQIAWGGAEDPDAQFVPVKVKGMSVEFTVDGQTYTGTASVQGLRLKDSSSGATAFLKRRMCSSYFG